MYLKVKIQENGRTPRLLAWLEVDQAARILERSALSVPLWEVDREAGGA